MVIVPVAPPTLPPRFFILNSVVSGVHNASSAGGRAHLFVAQDIQLAAIRAFTGGTGSGRCADAGYDLAATLALHPAARLGG
jgi:hypothetical protein